jgi:hypothetical protein
MSRPWNGRCHRCGKETNVHTMSRFNTDLICPECEDDERSHPDYEYARDVEAQACRGGNYNHPGVGWPGREGRVRR